MSILTQLFGIELPIIQAPMAGVQASRLALAVSAAGGLGSLPCALLSLGKLREELTALRAASAKPVNVNFFCHAEAPSDAQADTRWRAALAPYYREFGLDEAAPTAAGSRAPFSAAAAQLLAEFRPAVVSFHFGLPAPELLAQVRGCGAKVISTATTLEEALWLQAQGADAVIAQGLEAGGHRGHFRSDDLTLQMGTFALLPQLVRALRVPVIAAGGIADARSVAAAMALGAAGVQAGTSYLLCPEADTSAVHRAALSSESSRHTALTNVFSGRPARSIVNRIVRELGPISAAAPAFPLAGGAVAPLRAHNEARGSGDFSPLWSGQNASGCQALAAADVTRRLAGLT